MNPARSCNQPALGRWSGIFFAVGVLLFIALSGRAQPAFTNFLAIKSGTSQFALQYFSNRNPGTYSPDVTQLLIVLHGINYNADDYLAYGIQSAARCPGASTNTLILAPCLYITPFTVPPTNSTLYWLSSPAFGSRRAAYGWPQTNAVNFSAYSALDVLSSNLLASTNFPNLKRMVWFGNSAGGQLVNRYAACSTQNVQAAARAIHTRYIVSAPSSYLYFNEQRPGTNFNGTFFTPSLTTYPTYNDWGYGLTNLFEYPAARGAAFITNNYRQKFVVYCVGSLDNNPNDSSLDISDEAELQGLQRVQRATNYFTFVTRFYGTNISRFQTFCLVPGIAHDAQGILTSDLGVRSVFDYETNAVDSDGDGYSDWQEWLAGTNPNSAADRPGLSAALNTGGNNLALSWPTRELRRYQVLSTTNFMTNWTIVTDFVATNATRLTNLIAPVNGREFFRLAITPQ